MQRIRTRPSCSTTWIRAPLPFHRLRDGCPLAILYLVYGLSSFYYHALSVSGSPRSPTSKITGSFIVKLHAPFLTICTLKRWEQPSGSFNQDLLKSLSRVGLGEASAVDFRNPVIVAPSVASLPQYRCLLRCLKVWACGDFTAMHTLFCYHFSLRIAALCFFVSEYPDIWRLSSLCRSRPNNTRLLSLSFSIVLALGFCVN